MIVIDIPGFKRLEIAHLVLDFNGTLAVDGVLLPGVAERLTALADRVAVHVVTADTFGKVEDQMAAVPCRISVLRSDAQDREKRDYVGRLGVGRVMCVGNGRNDRLMLEAAALGVAVVLREGAAAAALMAADVVCRDIQSALDLLSHPLRLTATLRS